MSLTSFLYVIAVICPVSTQVINPTKEVIIFAFDSHVYKEIKRKQKKKNESFNLPSYVPFPMLSIHF